MRVIVRCSLEIARLKPDHGGTRPAKVQLAEGTEKLFRFGFSDTELDVSEAGMAMLLADPHLKVTLLDEALPVLNETPPVVNETPPIVDETPPLVNETPPIVDETPPIVDETPPLVNKANKPATKPAVKPATKPARKSPK